jgi:hypothetical protein
MSNYSIDIEVPPAPGPAPSGLLKVKGTEIVGEDGKPVILKGAGLGGHLNMENCKQPWLLWNHTAYLTLREQLCVLPIHEAYIIKNKYRNNMDCFSDHRIPWS